ncbi:MAG: hypothetical protein MUE81_12775 [Thermoflexibacter sp.]|jgi:hypothetical protein|nr:hypothetical protein [Thermoflexibacter sp.]
MKYSSTRRWEWTNAKENMHIKPYARPSDKKLTLQELIEKTARNYQEFSPMPRTWNMNISGASQPDLDNYEEVAFITSLASLLLIRNHIDTELIIHIKRILQLYANDMRLDSGNRVFYVAPLTTSQSDDSHFFHQARFIKALYMLYFYVYEWIDDDIEFVMYIDSFFFKWLDFHLWYCEAHGWEACMAGDSKLEDWYDTLPDSYQPKSGSTTSKGYERLRFDRDTPQNVAHSCFNNRQIEKYGLVNALSCHFLVYGYKGKQVISLVRPQYNAKQIIERAYKIVYKGIEAHYIFQIQADHIADEFTRGYESGVSHGERGNYYASITQARIATIAYERWTMIGNPDVFLIATRLGYWGSSSLTPKSLRRSILTHYQLQTRDLLLTNGGSPIDFIDEGVLINPHQEFLFAYFYYGESYIRDCALSLPQGGIATDGTSKGIGARPCIFAGYNGTIPQLVIKSN